MLDARVHVLWLPPLKGTSSTLTATKHSQRSPQRSRAPARRNRPGWLQGRPTIFITAERVFLPVLRSPLHQAADPLPTTDAPPFSVKP